MWLCEINESDMIAHTMLLGVTHFQVWLCRDFLFLFQGYGAVPTGLRYCFLSGFSFMEAFQEALE